MRKPLFAAVLLLSLVAGPILAQLPPECGTTQPLASPYVFILFDISGSQNHAAACTQAEYDAGQCAYVCSGAQCHTPMQADHPGSKWTQTRQALYDVLSDYNDVNFGFATFPNHDLLRVRAKHWLYQADTAGPVIPGGGGAFPAAGAQEVFGLTWPCTAGASDGCANTTPADLNDAWEVTRVRRLPKGGDAFTQTSDVYLRVGASTVYKVRYAPVAGGALGSPLQTVVTTWRCSGPNCSTTTLIGSQAVSWTPVGDFLSWENAASTASRNQPYSYFNQPTVAAATAAGLCPASNGTWEPNGDDNGDAYVQPGQWPYLMYSLKQPTDASDSRGSFFSTGDVIPLDWLDPHQDDLLVRLAPNLVFDPLATPDFRTASYFQDHAAPGEDFLRLRNEPARPMIPLGLTPLARSIRAFRAWYDGCLNGSGCSSATGWNDVAATQDPEWGCRRTHLLIITDNVDECPSFDPCADISSLSNQADVTTSIIAVGMSYNSQINCIAHDGRGEPFYPKTRQQIEDSLRDFFTNVVGVQP
jgi:hypothetical protein